VGFDLSVGFDRVDPAISLFENSLLRRRLHHHIDCRWPVRGSLLIAVMIHVDMHKQVHVIKLVTKQNTYLRKQPCDQSDNL